MMIDGKKVEFDWPRVAGGLVVAAVILIFLVKMLFGFRSDGRLSECEANLQTLATAAKKHAAKNRGLYPKELDDLVQGRLMQRLPTCPAANQMTYTDYTTARSPAAFSVSCCGGHHRKQFKGAGDPLKFPRYSTWGEPPAKK
jgi:hypothetical protein